MTEAENKQAEYTRNLKQILEKIDAVLESIGEMREGIEHLMEEEKHSKAITHGHITTKTNSRQQPTGL